MKTNALHSTADCEAVVLLNPSASGGTALRKWGRISETVHARFDDLKVAAITRRNGISGAVERFRRAGYTRFIAAGGDGTVNAVVNALMTSPAPESRFQLGAIALGSSNDYHKPIQSDQQIHGIPCKIDFGRLQTRDVGMLGFEDSRGEWQTRHWIINAALGLTAEANAFFNEPNAALDLLKRRSTSLAILYAAMHTMLRFRSQDRLLQVDALPWTTTSVTNLGVVKSPHFSGGFSYDSGFDPASGRFHVHLCENMPLPLALFTLWRLSRRRFTDLPRTRTWQTNHLVVTADNPFAVELDGEVIHSKRVAFAIADRRLEVCV